MRFISDKVEEVSTSMMMLVVASSLISILPIGYALFEMYDATVSWSESSSDYKLLWAVLIFLSLLMGGLVYMFLKMKIEINANATAIEARMFPFMRSYRVSNLSDIKSLEIIKFDSIMKYGGVGLKKQLGGLTSYTMTTSGHALRIKLKEKKELHVQIKKIAEWERYISEFKNQSI